MPRRDVHFRKLPKGRALKRDADRQMKPLERPKEGSLKAYWELQ